MTTCPQQIFAGPLQDARATRSGAGSRSTARARSRSRSEERRTRLHHRVTFLKDVCSVPAQVIAQKKWAKWVDKEGWTVLHWLAEHLNKRYCNPRWLDDIHIESFIEQFVFRGGDVNAVIGGDLGKKGPAGTAALHMVAHRRVAPDDQHELDVCRFAKALVVQGKADPNLRMSNERGRVPMSLALNTGRLELAKVLVQHGAHPHVIDGRGETVWEACAQHRKILDEFRQFLKTLRKEDICLLSRWPFLPGFGGSDSLASFETFLPSPLVAPLLHISDHVQSSRTRSESGRELRGDLSGGSAGCLILKGRTVSAKIRLDYCWAGLS